MKGRESNKKWSKFRGLQKHLYSIKRSFDLWKVGLLFFDRHENMTSCIPEESCNISSKLSGIFLWPRVWLFFLEMYSPSSLHHVFVSLSRPTFFYTPRFFAEISSYWIDLLFGWILCHINPYRLFLPYTNNSIYYKSFVCSRLNDLKYYVTVTI